MTDERDDRPRPGPNKPVPAWDEYEQLEQAVNNYLNHEPDDPSWNDIWRALAAIMGEYQRDAFVDAFDLAQPAETPCVRRLITGEEECTCHEKRGWDQRELETIGARDDPPHAPPYRDHAMLWLDESGDPAVYGMHVYPATSSAWKAKNHLTTSGSISSSSLLSGASKSRSGQSHGTISARQSTWYSTRRSGTDRGSFRLRVHRDACHLPPQTLQWRGLVDESLAALLIGLLVSNLVGEVLDLLLQLGAPCQLLLEVINTVLSLLKPSMKVFRLSTQILTLTTQSVVLVDNLPDSFRSRSTIILILALVDDLEMILGERDADLLHTRYDNVHTKKAPSDEQLTCFP